MELKEAKQILKSNRYLLENTSSSIAYHISPFKFDKFKISSKSGMGTNFYGNGIYLTFDKNVIEHFLKLMKDEYDYIYVYKVEISNTANIIEESDVGEYITDDIEEIDPSEISETLKVNGIDGVEYWNEEDGNSIVIFDANKIKIVNREEYMNIDKAKELLENKGYRLISEESVKNIQYSDKFRTAWNALMSAMSDFTNWNRVVMWYAGNKYEEKATTLSEAYANGQCSLREIIEKMKYAGSQWYKDLFNKINAILSKNNLEVTGDRGEFSYGDESYKIVPVGKGVSACSFEIRKNSDVDTPQIHSEDDVFKRTAFVEDPDDALDELESLINRL